MDEWMNENRVDMDRWIDRWMDEGRNLGGYSSSD
jgi:hypothetical protein